MVSNLLHNAIEYNVPGGAVELSCGVAGDALTVAVRDTGCGIPPEVLPRVFEPFRRGPHSGGDSVGSRGLGLFLLKTHVEALGGTYDVRPAAGNGTEFRFCLPRQSAVTAVRDDGLVTSGAEELR
jgi:signal transduction histidine kinase